MGGWGDETGVEGGTVGHCEVLDGVGEGLDG